MLVNSIAQVPVRYVCNPTQRLAAQNRVCNTIQLSRVALATVTDMRTPTAQPGAPAIARTLPVIQWKVLSLLGRKATGGKGYAAIQVPGYDAPELDDAIGTLHRRGLVNAFFVDGPAPRFHPSSLTPEGRRILNELTPRLGARVIRSRS
jgi:hypothetical protein